MPVSTAFVMPPKGLDLGYQRFRVADQGGGQRLDIVTAAQGIDHMGNPRFLGDDQLGVAGDTRRERCWQSDRFIQRIGVETLRPPQHGGHRLDGGADDVVVRILLGQADSRRLAMGVRKARLNGFFGAKGCINCAHS